MTTPNERPILFSGPMVRALLDGRKTVTRRLVDPLMFIETTNPDRIIEQSSPDFGKAATEWERCPFGVPGDRLWVRETWWNAEAYPGSDQNGEATRPSRSRLVHYAADGDPPNTPNRCYPNGLRNGAFAAPDPWASWQKHPSIHMPRWASRLTLEVVSVRVERLHDITEEDAKAEGLAGITKDGSLVKWGIPDRDGMPGTDDTGWPWADWSSDPRMAFRRLWESISGPGSWNANPWVWRVKFRKAVTP